MPISEYQERWDIYVDVGTREQIKPFLERRESLSGFARNAILRELRIRQLRAERAARKLEQEAAAS